MATQKQIAADEPYSHAETLVTQVEDAFRSFTSRDDVAVILITQTVHSHYPPLPSRMAEYGGIARRVVECCSTVAGAVTDPVKTTITSIAGPLTINYRYLQCTIDIHQVILSIYRPL